MKVATLGPAHSHSDACLHSVTSGKVETVYASAVNEAFSMLRDGKVDAIHVPLENLFHGPVLETYDALIRLHFESSKSQIKPEILFTCNYKIEHVIGVPKGVELSEVKRIYSHTQALAQSKGFIEQTLREAELCPVESTSLAAQIVAEEGGAAAAIGSLAAIEAAGLKACGETNIDDRENKTRFACIADPSLREEVLSVFASQGSGHAASICVHPRRDRHGLLLELLDIISRDCESNILSIHSRPDRRGGFIFFFELEDNASYGKLEEVRSALARYGNEVTSNVIDVEVLGRYERCAFSRAPIEKIGVIGSSGAMGAWFSEFFENAGFSVVGVDVDSSKEEIKNLSSCDVVLFSVPIDSLQAAYSQYKQSLPTDGLLVDNSSVKGESLKILADLPSVEVLGIHTMFGPKELSLQGKNIVITHSDKSGEKAKAFESILYKHGARLVSADSDTHDQLVAYTQGLVHFLSILFGVCLKKSGFSAGELRDFGTPNYERFLENVKRIIAQSPELTAKMQLVNAYTKKAQDDVVEVAKQLSSVTKSESEFLSQIEELRNYFDKS